jgi:hypothetical protein
VARRAAPNEDRTRVTLTWVFSRSDLATVGSVQPRPYRRYLLKVLCSLLLHFLGSIESVQACIRFRGVCTPSPLTGLSGRFGGSVSYIPPFCLHACTLCMLVLCEARGIFEVYWQGFSEIVLQIPLETAIFAERILRKERERPDLSLLTPEYRSRAGVSLRVHACKGVHRAVHDLYAWSVQACTRSRRIRAPLPLSATLQAKRRVSVLLCPWSNAHDSGIPSQQTLRSYARPFTCSSFEAFPRRSASCATSRPCCDP